MKWRAWSASMLHCVAFIATVVGVESGYGWWAGSVAGFFATISVRLTISAAQARATQAREDEVWEGVKRG